MPGANFGGHAKSPVNVAAAAVDARPVHETEDADDDGDEDDDCVSGGFVAGDGTERRRSADFPDDFSFVKQDEFRELLTVIRQYVDRLVVRNERRAIK